FRNFGGKTGFSGKVCTIKAFESNPLVRTLFESPGEGRVLVVDAGGSMRCAMLGDNIAEVARPISSSTGALLTLAPSQVISKMDIGVKALNTHPVKSHKNDPGLHRDVPVRFGGVTIKPGQFLYADADGIVV
ncbi:ribonuclease E inhibitor RraA/Dimethylmenaquinone methyltransferase, partial [Baffinella frigidus]